MLSITAELIAIHESHSTRNIIGAKDPIRKHAMIDETEIGGANEARGGSTSAASHENTSPVVNKEIQLEQIRQRQRIVKTGPDMCVSRP